MSTHRIFQVHLLLLLFCSPTALLARIHPEPGAVLNQRQLILEWDEVPGADRYQVELIRIDSAASKRAASSRITFTTSALYHWVTEGLAFGHAYRWQYRAYQRNKLIFTSPKYPFSIQAAPHLLSTRFRTDVLEGKTRSTDLFFLDRLGIAINRNGEPIWFTPGTPDSLMALTLRDLELTPWGTITYLDANGAYEKNLQHQRLWQAPNNGEVSGGPTERYHHELMALPNGDFMVAGFAATNEPSNVQIKQSAAHASNPNTIIRYNQQGLVTWSWNEAKKGRTDTLLANYRKPKLGSHLNGFCFTPDQRKLIVSFKNYSDVGWMDIDSGRFVGSIKRTTSSPSTAFQQQHGPRFTSDGRFLLLYNNNLPNEEQEPAATQPNNPSVVWYRWLAKPPFVQFADSYSVVSARHPEGITGKEGYVCESRPGHLLICAGGANYLAEVTLAKRKTWEGYFYYRREADSNWLPLSNYRCQPASSLYPWYVTAQVANQKSTPSLLITNAGTEPHTLLVRFTRRGSEATQSQSTRLLLPKAGAEISLPQAFIGVGEFEVNIQSTQFQGHSKTYRFRSASGELLPISTR